MKIVKDSVFQGGKLILWAKENFELSERFFSHPWYGPQKLISKLSGINSYLRISMEIVKNSVFQDGK